MKEKKIYQGEIGELYEVSFRYDQNDNWFKRCLIDIWLWLKKFYEETK